MMINCPKCNLLQPKDQYCAQCGVNMETYKPPQKPFLKKLLSNWMVQLGLLFVVILGIVMWDNIANRKSSVSESPPPPVSNTIERADIAYPDEPPPPPQPIESQSSSPQNANFAPDRRQSPSQNQQPSASAFQLKKQVSLKMLTITPPAIESLEQVGRRLDDGVFVVQSKSNFLSSNRKNIRGFGSAIRKDYQLGQPIDLFYGEIDQETGLSLGFYAQITVAEGSTAESINIEGRVWHQLRLSDEPSSPLFFEATVQQQDGIIFIDPSLHDSQFTPEEIALFESSRKLSLLNDELFVENLSDIALFIEIK